MARKKSVYLQLEAKIDADEHGGIMHRWQYGREALKAKAGRQQLPHGLIDSLIAEAERAGKKISRTEIQRRVRCAEVYDQDSKVRRAATHFGSWNALAEAGFPPMESDEPDDLEAAGISTAAPDAFEQLSLVPGLAAELKVRGRTIRLEDATIADVEAYHDMYEQIHANFGKRLALIKLTLAEMRDAAGGDPSANAVEAWKLAHGLKEN